MGLKFTIEHLASKAKFELINVGLRTYSESFGSSWNAEEVFGRMDPILSYSGTKRNLDFELKVTGKQNVAVAQAIARALYPTYNNQNALSLKEPPLVRIKFANLLRASENKGLLCAIESLTVDRGERYFSTSLRPEVVDKGNTTDDKGNLMPSAVVLNFKVIPLHEYNLGWFEVSNDEELQGLDFLQVKTDDEGEAIIVPLKTLPKTARVYKFGSSKATKEIYFSNLIDGQLFTNGTVLAISGSS